MKLFNTIKSHNHLKAIQIVLSSEDNCKCSVILSDTMFSNMYVTEYNDELENKIKDLINDDVLLIKFIDNELNEAWKSSYLQGGITEDRWDRRVVFHPYNDMNEMFCMDEMLIGEIKGNYRGFTDEHLPNWKMGIIRWYREHTI